MKYIIIGTAGHVDHGKTALIKALTGTDTDRLKEEKARGISIDLGFASLRLNEEVTAGIVDVPGHERFMKNMLAGTGGIDIALLVIAADEGVMPQTREHLAMLDLLGIKQGLVALTKSDKVDKDWLDLVEEDVRQLLATTFLANAPICRVSAVSGTGLESLRQLLLAAALKVPGRDNGAPFRLWIDRVFTVKGHGVVVTGSALSGSVSLGEQLAVYPAGNLLRVRGLEWHGNKVEHIYAGQRSAINLGGEDTAELARGMVLSSPLRGQISNRWDIAAEWQQPVTSGTRIRLHLGTGEFLGRVYRFKDQPEQYMRLILEKPLAAGLGDRGIVRQYSPQYLLGGVTLIAPGRQSRKITQTRLQLAKTLGNNSIAEIIYGIIADAGQPETVGEIHRQAGYYSSGIISKVLKDLVAAKKIVPLGSFYLTYQLLDQLECQLSTVVGQCHREHPQQAGLSKDILRQKLDLKERAFEELLARWQESQLVTLRGAEVALREFAVRHSDWRQNLLEKAKQVLDGIGMEPVDWQQLLPKLQLSAEQGRAAQDILVKAGVLIRVGELQLYSKTIEEITKLIRLHFEANSTLTVAEFRDLLGTSRKVALPLLEYFDMLKYTLREGNERRCGPKLRDS